MKGYKIDRIPFGIRVFGIRAFGSAHKAMRKSDGKQFCMKISNDIHIESERTEIEKNPKL
jgi:hypothetical protein